MASQSLASAILSLILSTSTTAAEGVDVCEQFGLGVMPEAELLDLFGPPCSVQMSWDSFKNRDSASHTLVYAAVCAVRCPPDGPDDLPFIPVTCHSYAPEKLLAGPLGSASGVRFHVRDGVVAVAEWEYSRDKVPSARAMLGTGGFDVETSASVAWTAHRDTQQCSIYALEEPQPEVMAVAYPSEGQ